MAHATLIDVQAAASAALTAHDNFMSGRELSPDQKEISDAVAMAGCYAIAAYEAHNPKSGGECSAMIWAFLTALIDPLSKDLDGLRADPAAGDAARAARNQS